MKKLKFLLAATFFVATFSVTARAQAPLATDTEADPYNREIGFGTNILLNTIFNSYSAPLDFMYKWKSGNGYFRLGTSIGYSKHDNFYNHNTSTNRYENLQSSLILGREWRQPLAKRWQVNYGGDLLGRYGSSFRQSENFSYFRESENNVIERINVQKYMENQYGISLRPFLGVLFKVNKSLYLGTEASFSAGFLKKAGNRDAYNMQDGERLGDIIIQGNKHVDGYDVTISTNAASNIFLYYRF